MHQNIHLFYLNPRDGDEDDDDDDGDDDYEDEKSPLRLREALALYLFICLHIAIGEFETAAFVGNMMAGETRQEATHDEGGWVGFANLPNQVHRKSVKKGFEFTLMVVGESGLGKSTLINTLFLTDIYASRVLPDALGMAERTVSIEASAVEIEERGVRLRLTVVDTPGYSDPVDASNCFDTIVRYVDAQFEKFLKDESGLNRRNIMDSRVHCCFYFVNPLGHGLKPLDLQFMKALHSKINIVPVIAKADTLTKNEILRLKQKILSEIELHGINIYSIPSCEDDEDEEYKEQCRQLKAAVPFAVVGSNAVMEIRSRKVRGRQYPWGVVEVENPEHCDFVKLRTMLIAHMQDLQEVTQEVHYENFRLDKISAGNNATARTRNPRISIDMKEEKLTEKEKMLMEKEAELKKMHEIISRMQEEMRTQGSMTSQKNLANEGNSKNVSVV